MHFGADHPLKHPHRQHTVPPTNLYFHIFPANLCGRVNPSHHRIILQQTRCWCHTFYTHTHIHSPDPIHRAGASSTILCRPEMCIRSRAVLLLNGKYGENTESFVVLFCVCVLAEWPKGAHIFHIFQSFLLKSSSASNVVMCRTTPAPKPHMARVSERSVWAVSLWRALRFFFFVWMHINCGWCTSGRVLRPKSRHWWNFVHAPRMCPPIRSPRPVAVHTHTHKSEGAHTREGKKTKKIPRDWMTAHPQVYLSRACTLPHLLWNLHAEGYFSLFEEYTNMLYEDQLYVLLMTNNSTNI